MQERKHAVQREADDVRKVALDAAHEERAAPLDRKAARAVRALARRDVCVEHVVWSVGKVHLGALRNGAHLEPGRREDRVHECDARDHSDRLAAQVCKYAEVVRGVVRLFQHLLVVHEDRVSADHEGRRVRGRGAHEPLVHLNGLVRRSRHRVLVDMLANKVRLVEVLGKRRRHDLRVHADAREQFRTPRTPTREHEALPLEAHECGCLQRRAADCRTRHLLLHRRRGAHKQHASAESARYTSSSMQVLGRAPAADGAAIALPLLALVSEARSEHGMRDYDWARYRRFCTAKTRRMRRSMHLTHTDAPPAPKKTRTRKSRRRAHVSPAQQSAAAKGTRHAFVPRHIDAADVCTARPFELLVFETEHAWAAAGEAHAADDVRGARGRARRAAKALAELEKLVAAHHASLSARDRAQAAAYACYVRAAAAFYTGASVRVLTHGAVALHLFALLAACAPSGRDEALAHSFADALNAPLRFAMLQEQIDADVDAYAAATATPERCAELVPDYAALAAELRAGAQHEREPITLTWRTHTMVIRSVDAVDALERVRVEEAALADAQKARADGARGARERLSHAARNRKRAGAGVAAGGGGRDPYDRVLAALADAEHVMRTLVDENASALRQNHSERYKAAGADLRRAHEVLLYRLLAVRVARNVRLAEQVEAKAHKRDAKAAALYERRRLAHRGSAPSAAPAKTRAPKRARAAWVAQRRTKRGLRKLRPARSGQRREVLARHAAAEARAHGIVVARAAQRRLRVVPGIARLLDGATSSLDVMGGLVIVEGEPDVSSVVEAKRHWYCAQLMLVLARAFSQLGLNAHARLLLQRGELYVRQAAQALELAEGAEAEDAHFAPHLLRDPAAITRVRDEIGAALGHVEAALVRSGTGDAAVLEASHGGRIMLAAALRHVTFEDIDLAHAAALAPERVAELTGANVPTETEAMEVEIERAEAAEMAAEEDAVPASAPATEPAYDPRNAQLEEEELATERTRRSWFSWFTRS